jgi:hypothetical protein
VKDQGGDAWARCSGWCLAEHQIRDMHNYKDANGEITSVCRECFDRLCRAADTAARSLARKKKEDEQSEWVFI